MPYRLLPRLLRPQETVSTSEVRRGLRALTVDGVCGQVMGVLSGGAFLAAFALLLGAPNVVIGLLASIGPLSQILQIPATLLIERSGLRKVFVVGASLSSRLLLVVAAAVPFVLPTEWQVLGLLGALFAYFGFATISGCAWNSWVQDLVAEDVRGRYFGQRLAIATGVGAAMSLLGAGFVEWWASTDRPEVHAYSALFATGAAVGLIGVVFLARAPEPLMARGERRPFRKVFAEPFGDANFRSVLRFLALWNFVFNLASPFFAVYMLERLQLDMLTVIVLAVLSQAANVVFFNVWGRFADRFSNKTVLGVTGPLFMFAVALWPFTTLPDRHVLSVPMLVVVHVLIGIATAGTLLCASNIALELAPRGRGTAYLAANALVSGVAACIAPIVGGILGDLLADQSLRLDLTWVSGSGANAVEHVLPAFDFRGLDFVFVAAVLLGFVAMWQLVAVREEGEVEEDVLVQELYAQVRRGMASVSNVAGLRRLTYFPYSILRGVGRRLSPARRRG